MFGGLLSATTLFLWNAHRLTPPQRAASVAALTAGLWLVGWLGERFAP